jgi:hypothetical protein
MKRVLFCFFILVAGGAIDSKAQVAVDSMINLYGQFFPQEKLHLHMDKPVYSAGESIWFKSYIFSGIYPSKYSTNFYIEMINPNTGDVLQRKMYPIYEGTSSGNLDIPADFKLPAVIIRAYTPWMLNFDEGFVYNKRVKIISPEIPLTTDTASLPPTIDFLPEGGNFVAGMVNNIAFKATDHFGDPIQAIGEVKDSKGSIVAEFMPDHDGMGKFELTPVAGEKYTATWRDDKKKTHTKALPAVQPVGVTLKLGLIDGALPFVLERSKNAPANLQTLNVIAHFNQQVVYKARINLTSIAVISGKIPVENIPTGIITVTVFDNNWNAIAERIAFVNAEDYNFNIQVNPIDKDLRKRAYNSVVVEVPDEISANMSIAITDADASATNPDDDNILSRLLLTGDLKGKIYSPYYYFLGNDEYMKSQLDLVMLTNGWRKYNWEKLTKGGLPEIKVSNENYLSLKATITGLLPSQVPKQAQLNVFMVLPDSSKQMFAMPYQNEQFIEKELVFYDTVKLYYQFNKDESLAARGTVNFSTNTLRPPMKMAKDSAWFVPLPLDTALLNRNKFFADELARITKDSKKGQVLQTVTVTAQRKTKVQELDEQYTNGLFKGGDSYQFDMENEVAAAGMQSIFQFLQGRVAGLQITTAGGGVNMTWRGQTPIVFIDEMQMDAQSVMNIPVNDIAYVKVLRPPFFGAPGGGAGGAIAIYTKRGKASTADIPSHLSQAVLYGYNSAKVFYSPNYAEKSDAHAAEDLRSTLYWNPYVLTDSNSKRVKIEFFNNDITKKYRIIVEGMTPEGKLARVEKLVNAQ